MKRFIEGEDRTSDFPKRLRGVALAPTLDGRRAPTII